MSLQVLDVTGRHVGAIGDLLQRETEPVAVVMDATSEIAVAGHERVLPYEMVPATSPDRERPQP